MTSAPNNPYQHSKYPGWTHSESTYCFRRLLLSLKKEKDIASRAKERIQEEEEGGVNSLSGLMVDGSVDLSLCRISLYVSRLALPRETPSKAPEKFPTYSGTKKYYKI